MEVILSRYPRDVTKDSSTTLRLAHHLPHAKWISLDEANNLDLSDCDCIWNRIIWRDGEIDGFPDLRDSHFISPLVSNMTKAFCQDLRSHRSMMVSCDSDIDIGLFPGRVVLKEIHSSQGVGVSFFDGVEDALVVVSGSQGSFVLEDFIETRISGRPHSVRVFVTQQRALFAYDRVGAVGSSIANICGGGSIGELNIQLSANQLGLVSLVRRRLVENSIHFAGVDFVGDHLIEVNVCSPYLPYFPDVGVDFIPELIEDVRVQMLLGHAPSL